MKEYRKVVNIKAVQWTGTKKSHEECEEFVGKYLDVIGGMIRLDDQSHFTHMVVPIGHYIVQEVDGLGFYKVHPYAFEKMYREVVK